MDHLGLDRFHVLGGCIGGSFCLKAVEMAPKRVMSAVLQNPIGVHPEHPTISPKATPNGPRNSSPLGRT